MEVIAFLQETVYDRDLFTAATVQPFRYHVESPSALTSLSLIEQPDNRFLSYGASGRTSCAGEIVWFSVTDTGYSEPPAKGTWTEICRLNGTFCL